MEKVFWIVDTIKVIVLKELTKMGIKQLLSDSTRRVWLDLTAVLVTICILQPHFTSGTIFAAVALLLLSFYHIIFAILLLGINAFIICIICFLTGSLHSSLIFLFGVQRLICAYNCLRKGSPNNNSNCEVLREASSERMERKPTDKELADLSKCIVTQWSFVAIWLGVSNIDDIRMNYAGNVNQQAFEMLKRWREEKSMVATVQSLCIALRKEGLNETFRKIFPDFEVDDNRVIYEGFGGSALSSPTPQRVSSVSDWDRLIMPHLNYLINHLPVDDTFLNCLMERGIQLINYNEKEEVNAKATRKEKIQHLIERILRFKGEGSFEKFCEALTRSGQAYIVQIFTET